MYSNEGDLGSGYRILTHHSILTIHSLTLIRFLLFFFFLFLHLQTSCQCVRLRVTIIEGGPGASADGPNREASLREIFLTRWPGAIVEFEQGYAANLNG